MNIGPVWSLIDAAETSSLPEAVWHQTADNGPGFFVSLLQRWDIASDQTGFKSVFYHVTPFLKSNANQDFPTFSLRLPKELAVVEGTANITTMEANGVQERRVPLLVRFSENKSLLAMQFSSTMVRIGVPHSLANEDQQLYTKCNHWTVDIAANNKYPYAPVSSTPEALPSIPKKTTNSETILPGAGLFWLDLSCGSNARGEDYQEHMVVLVTTRSLLCYTVTIDSINKNKTTVSMKLSHHFSHPQASAAWWHPKSVALVVGSYQATKSEYSQTEQPLLLQTYFFAKGPFASQREVLQNPLLLPLRLERPPPVRCPAFPAATSTYNATVEDLSDSMEGSSSSSRSRKFPTRCVSVVSLCGKSYIVAVAAQTVRNGAGKHCMDIQLHELDPDNCNVSTQRHQIRVVLPKKIQASKEDILFVVLDNLLCVSFRNSRLHLFLDIQDVGESAFVVEKMTSELEQTYLVPSTVAVFVPPCYLFLPKTGLVLPLALDLERLAPSVVHHERCNFSMLLRRQSGRTIALARFSTIGALAESVQRWNWMDQVASAYARYPESMPLQWDLQSTLPLIFHCALLPDGCEFLPLCEAASLPDTLEPSSAVVIHQQEVLTKLFLPKIKTTADSSKPSEEIVLRRIAELVVSYIGALEKHGSCACPSLQVLAFALLWRLGDAPVIQGLLKNRTWAFAGNPPSDARTYLGTKWQVYALMAIVHWVEFGSWGSSGEGCKLKPSVYKMFRQKTLTVATTLLRSRCDYRLAAEHIRLLLSHERLLDAISVATDVLDRAADSLSASCLARAALVYARKINHGSDFVAVAFSSWTFGLGANISSLSRQVYLLHSFLIKWDPACLDTCHTLLAVGGANQQVRDDLDLLRIPQVKMRPSLSRRPSWISMSFEHGMGDGRGKTNPKGPKQLGRGATSLFDWVLYQRKLHFQ